MKQTSRGSLKGLFREATIYQSKDVLTCCRTVVHQCCRIELSVQTGISLIKQTVESSIKQRITDRNQQIFI